jgi:hypothetical protein
MPTQGNKSKRNEQLGMNAGTASHRLVKDILFDFVSKSGCVCYRCGEKMCRETFSIEHKTPWLDSDNPVGLFFDLSNISFSHRICNSMAGNPKINDTPEKVKEARRVQKLRYKEKLGPVRWKEMKRKEYLRFKEKK